MPPSDVRLFCGFDSTSVAAGGVARVARLMAKALHEGALVGRADGIALHDADPALAPTVPVRSMRGSQLRFAAAVAAAKFRHSHALYNFIGLARAHRLTALPSRPYGVFLHGYEVWKPLAETGSFPRVARAARLLLANSDYTRTRAAEINPDYGRARVCWLGSEDDAVPAPRAPRNGPPQVLIVGRIDEGWKGHQELIAIWPAVTDRVPDALLTVVGSGPRRAEFEALARQSRAAANIRFLGFVPEDRMDDVWADATVYAMPGVMEGFGLVYVEAMRHGVPVIASRQDAGQEINVHGVTGYNVDRSAPTELTDRVIELLTDRDRAAAMGRAGRLRWAEHFRFSAFRARFEGILRELVAAN